MNFFDKFIDSFSTKDLSKRVNLVIAFGIAIIAITSVCGYYFLNHNYVMSINGVVTEDGAFMDNGGAIIIKISVDHDDIERLPRDGKLQIDTNAPMPEFKTQNISIRSINPTSGVIEITFADESLSAPIKKGEEVKLIVTDTPLWKLLFSK
ncbi:MAG: hypothetical protein HN337_01195 [Deltaproteobacteria bacterium]|jgi:hypothetical protein|nr:hypothetical protein [Deltaproteobacteria bacterium]